MFSEKSEVGTGSELEQTEILRTAFWIEIPVWRDFLSQESCQVLLAFYNFGLSLEFEALREGEGGVDTK
jgi:hypothetical protein